MRHPYVADAGDFGKYGLLRLICRECGISLGVVWYLTDAHEHNKDGKHDGYLKNGSARRRASYRDCDPTLYDRMKEIRQHEQLGLHMVQDGIVLPDCTAFYDQPVPTFRGRVRNRQEQDDRWRVRDEWHAAALEAMDSVDCVFTDADNGIIFTNEAALRRRKPSHKHSYWHEINDYLSRGQSVIAYHHLGRQEGGHTQHIEWCLNQILERGYEAWAIHYRRGTARAFVVIPQPEHRDALWQCSERFAEQWSRHAAMVAS